MEITKEYLESQIAALEERKTNESANAQKVIANVTAIDGALQALKGLSAYLAVPTNSIPDEQPDATAGN